MSRSLGGRTSVASRAPARTILRPTPADVVGNPCCDFSASLDTIANNPATPTPEGRTAHQFFLPASGDESANPCSPDMALTATIVNWDGDTSGDNALSLDVRQSITSPYGAEFNVEDILSGGNARYYLGTSAAGTGSTNHVDLAKPVPGDAFKLELIGNAATVYKNGGSILTATLAGIVMPTTFQTVASAGCLASGSGGGPYEVRATVAFNSYC